MRKDQMFLVNNLDRVINDKLYCQKWQPKYVVTLTNKETKQSLPLTVILSKDGFDLIRFKDGNGDQHEVKAKIMHRQTVYYTLRRCFEFVYCGAKFPTTHAK